MKFYSLSRTWYLLLLFIVACIIRSATFYFFIAPNGYYKQPDTPDYHHAALCIAYDYGMTSPYTREPLFWRTPGYPLYLSYFYKYFSKMNCSGEFNAYTAAQHASIWTQIILCSCIPIIIFFLALQLTSTAWIAWIASIISVIHIGFIIASTHILTDGLASVFFYLFLLFFFKALAQSSRRGTYATLLAIVLLSIYTWMRPLGEIIGWVSAILLLCCASGSWKDRILKAGLFISSFLATLLPWYIRNFKLTGRWFFCPTIGPYFTCFCAPKIISRIHNQSLLDAHKYCQAIASQAVAAVRSTLPLGHYVSPLACTTAVIPILCQYPGWFLYDWLVEVFKTLFDLYSYQFVAIVTDTYWYDPIQEFLGEKIAACLYAQPMPFFMRAIAIAELLYAMLLWIGLLAGAWHFMFKPFFIQRKNHFAIQHQIIWWSASILIGVSVGLSGGFGYARLRLPAEPLMIILSLMWWHWFLYNRSQKEQHATIGHS